MTETKSEELVQRAPDPSMERHDHQLCINRVLADVDRLVADRGLRLTKARRRVLEILLEAHEAMGAYDILARLSEEGVQPQPPVVYRALDFLQAHGLAHKIEGLAAYVACMHPRQDHAPVFLVCRNCRAVAESLGSNLQDRLAPAASELGFVVEHVVVEATGLCPKCREAA